MEAEQEKRRREEALAQATGLGVLSVIVEAVSVRLMKRDLLFVVERLVPHPLADGQIWIDSEHSTHIGGI